MKITYSHVVTALLLIAIVIICCTIKTCKDNVDTATDWKGMYSYLVQKTDSTKNNVGVKVIEQQPAVVSNDKLIKKLSAEIFDLKNKQEKLIKKVRVLVSVDQNVKVTDDFIPFDKDDAPVKPEDYFVNDMVHKDSVIIPPYPFHKKDSGYSISGVILKSGVKIDSLSFKNTVTWRLAEKKSGFLHLGSTLTVQAINSSKYFDNTGMKSIISVKKKTAWDKWIKPVIGFGVGIFIGNKLN